MAEMKENISKYVYVLPPQTKMREKYVNMYTFADLLSAISLEFTECRDAMNSSGHLLQYCTHVTGER